MAFISHFQVLKDSDKSKAIEQLIADSTPDFDFFLLVILSVLMATFGMILDSTAVVIGSMLIAPILHPILSLSLGVSLSDYKLMYRSGYTLLKSIVLAVGAGVVATLFFANGDNYLTSEVLSRTEPSLLYFAVAIIAGVAVSYALVRPDVSDALPGIAVSVALIPPLAVVGVGLAKFNWDVVAGSSVLFIVNVIGIVFASMVTFSLVNVRGKEKVADEAIKKEDKRVEAEEEKAQEISEEDKGKEPKEEDKEKDKKEAE